MFGFRFLVFNATFNNFSVISWRSALLVEETGVFAENHKVYHIIYLVHLAMNSLSGDRHRLHR